MQFTDSSNSLTCVAGVVSNLLHPPEINLTQREATISTANAFSLTQEISTTSDAGPFTCTVCIEVPEADIKDHCSNKTVSLSRMGIFKHIRVYTYHMISHYLQYQLQSLQ